MQRPKSGGGACGRRAATDSHLEVELKWLGSIAVCAAAVLLPAAAFAENENEKELKQDAVHRLVESHDAALSVYIGRVYVKQAALAAARDLLAQKGQAAGLSRTAWTLEAPEWQAAEHEMMQGVDQIIKVEVADPAWVKEAWSVLADKTLNAEEADEIAVHFESEGGQLQRQVIEWFVGELTLQTYTFTNRLKYGVPGSEQEMRDLQIVTYERKGRFPPIYDLSKYPNAMRFATRDPGVRYFKMMVMQGVNAVHVYLEKSADEARALVRSRAGLADPHIAKAVAESGTRGQ